MTVQSILLLSISQRNTVAGEIRGAIGAASLTKTMRSCSNIDCGREEGETFISLPLLVKALSVFALLLFSADACAFAGTASARDHLSVTLLTRKNGSSTSFCSRFPVCCGKVQQRRAE